jgi:hypothetical protein
MGEFHTQFLDIQYHVDSQTQRVEKISILVGSAFRVICDIFLDRFVERDPRIRLARLKILPPSSYNVRTFSHFYYFISRCMVRLCGLIPNVLSCALQESSFVVYEKLANILRFGAVRHTDQWLPIVLVSYVYRLVVERYIVLNVLYFSRQKHCMSYIDLFTQSCHKCQTVLAFDAQEQLFLPPLLRKDSNAYHLHCI